MTDELLEVRGMVIKHRAVGDYDWAVTLLTLERGKISAFAKGARRMGSRLSGSTEPFCFGTFRLYQGRSAFSIDNAQIENYFAPLREAYAKACYGTFFLELADYYARENNDARELLRLLYQSLRALERDRIDPVLIRCVYELRALAIEGEYPGAPERSSASPLWRDATLYALQHITQTPIERLYTFTVSGEVLAELKEITATLRHRFIDRPLKSLALLDPLEA